MVRRMPTNTAPSGFTMAELHTLPDDALARVQAIYEESFPAAERVPFEEIVEATRAGKEITSDVALGDDGQPIGFAFFSSLDAAGWLFFEYFAVASDRRGAGVGQALSLATTAALRARGEHRPFAIEVEDPAAATDDADRTVREKRIGFWEKVGASMLPVEGYVIPQLDGDGTLAMKLMWLPGPDSDRVPDEAELLEVVVALYEVGYGLAPDHELVRKARNGGVRVVAA